ncbi:serine hydrolase domain-containing protein [Streptomyces zingiberis]|uniref:Beta-lactamase family protein n=1 Tax=Streptomyces zingiberis TaxID=2053010 RepID=A0ABX1BTY5_9ACTN|nr:serine hydrolase domain-containing protein [Streptomyces zingiberis]NJP99211.1 beta-lactamase family protein [Streptomyces zingiberis]
MTALHDSLLPETVRALHHRAAVAQAEGRAPSLAAAVVRGGRTVWSGGYGALTPAGTPEGPAPESPAPDGAAPGEDTQYRVGSLTKTFTAVLVLRLREEGLIGLDDPLEHHLPGTGVGEVTVAQLLCHGAGLAAETPGPWWERTPGETRPALRDVLGDRPVLHPAGRRFHYSNPGYALLGALVEALREEPWEAVLRREVLEPLGMARTGVRPRAPYAAGWAVHPWADVLLPEPAEDLGIMAPAGQLWSTAADLGRFAAFLMRGDERVLPAGVVAEMREPAAVPARDGWEAGYGLGLLLLRRDGRVLFGHGGSLPGYLATLWISAEDDVAGIVLANATAGPAVGPAAGDLVSIVADREPRIPEPWRPLSTWDPELLELTGPWYWGPVPFAVRLLAGRGLELTALAGMGRTSRFRAEPDATWTGLDGYYLGETLRPVRRSDGTLSHLDLGSFVFTREPYDPAAPVPGGVDRGGWRPLP